MKFKTVYVACTSLLMVSLAGQEASAKVSAQEAEKLGQSLTCVGAEKSGNQDGSIPPWSGKWLGTPPGINFHPGDFHPDPYASEKPLFVITAKNMAQYANRLTAGQKALLDKYPTTFQIPVYPSHRDFRYPDWMCATAKQNALSAVLTDEGKGVNAVNGAIAFPIPENGLEMLRNTLWPYRAWKELAIFDQAVVYPNGDSAWGRVSYKQFSPASDPKQRGKTDGIAACFNVQTLKPERNKGEIIVGHEFYNYAKSRQAWQYNPGTRRVRQMPEFGFDMPQGPGGFRTVDDDRLFNGSPERYSWKIVGKKEMYIPYDAYRLNDPKVKYRELLKPGHVNPAYMRYELHRVWVLEGALKEGYRHLYAKRVMYLDEDTWHAVMSDNYDTRGQLWRVGMVNYFYAYEMEAFQAGVAIYHDLVSGAYMADRLVNEQPKGVSLNTGVMGFDDCTPDAARRTGL